MNALPTASEFDEARACADPYCLDALCLDVACFDGTYDAWVAQYGAQFVADLDALDAAIGRAS